MYIYINSLSDMGFAKIDKRNIYSKLIKLPKTQPLIDFNLKTNINFKKTNMEDTSKFKETVIKNDPPVIENKNTLFKYSL